MRVSFPFAVIKMNLDKKREERSKAPDFPRVESRQVPCFVILQ